MTPSSSQQTSTVLIQDDEALRIYHSKAERRTRTYVPLPILSLLLLFSLPAFTSGELRPFTTTSTTGSSPNRQLQTSNAEEAPLGEPECNAVGDQFVCDITMLLTEANTTTAVEAALECPLNDNVAIDLAATDPETCGCNAVLSTVGNSTDRAPRQCTCHYCPEVGTALALSIDCSGNEPDPFVMGSCKAIGCDGTCLDKVIGGGDGDPNTPVGANPNATAAPSAAPTPNTTQTPTQDATSSTTTQVPDTTEAPNSTAAPTTTVTATTTTQPPTQEGVADNTNDGKKKIPWWIPSAFYVRSTTAEPTEEDWMALQKFYLGVVSDVAMGLHPQDNNMTSTRYLRQQEQSSTQQRQLTVTLAPTAAELYQTENAACPQDNGGTCHLVYARYLLLLTDEETPSQVYADYTKATQDAIQTQPIRNSPFTMAGGTQPFTPSLVSRNCNLCGNAEATFSSSKAFPGHPDFTCGDLATLYSEQRFQNCLNYDVDWPSQSLRQLAEEWPLHHQDYCQCPTEFSYDSTTCPKFCPNNRKVPQYNMDVVVDLENELTCGQLETYGEFVVADPERCLAISRHGAICCTEDIEEEEATMEPTNATSPPTVPGTQLVKVNNSFLVYSPGIFLTAGPIMTGPELVGLSAAYAALVDTVVDELGGSRTSDPDYVAETGSSTASAAAGNETRHMRSRLLARSSQQRRQLSVTLDATSAKVHTVLDTECPSTVAFNATCSKAYGSYELRLLNEENPDLVASKYTNYTQEAIDRGLLGEILKDEDPLSFLLIKEATPDLVPPVLDTTLTVSPKVLAEEGGYDEFFTLGIGLSITAIVACFVGSMCASDWSGMGKDDDSLGEDPWEKEKSRRSLGSKSSSRREKERAPSKKDRKGKEKPKTDKQEYMFYRDQVEKLILQKMPEEVDNIDELLDLFYDRELILIATIKHMPDASEHGEEDGPTPGFSGSYDSFQDWDGDSSDEFGEETGDESEEEEEEEESSDDDSDKGGAVDEIARSHNTIQEGDEGEETSTEHKDEDVVITAAPPPEPVLVESEENEEESSDEEDETDDLVMEQENNTLILEHAENTQNMASVVPPESDGQEGSESSEGEGDEDEEPPEESTAPQ